MAAKKKSAPKKTAKAFTTLSKEAALDELRIVQDILLLVDVKVSLAALQARTTDEVLAAEHWGAIEYLRAGDNKVRRAPKPKWLPLSETEKRLAKRK